MFKKVLIILILSFSLAYFLFLMPVLNKNKLSVRLIDRLPNAEFIGKLNVLELARESSSIFSYYKIPFKDLASYEFLLSQAKSYGLNLQKPIYIFGNNDSDFGCLIDVKDKKKLELGIERIKKSSVFKDTIIEKKKVFYNKKDKIFLHYGDNYLLIYSGESFKGILNSVVNAKPYKISPLWSRFLRDKHFIDEHLIIYSNSNRLKDVGITTAIFAHDSDSSHFKLKYYLYKPTSFHIKKKDSGLAFNSIENATKSIELHLDISELKKNLDDPIINEFLKISKQIRFPIIDFIKAWEGDLCFVEGGNQTIRESYIETIVDENFNTTEVKRFKETSVPGYSLYFSTNDYLQKFLDVLLNKGIMTNENDKIRFLFSPLLSIKKSNGYVEFHSGHSPPRLFKNSNNTIVWKNKGTDFLLNIDTLNQNEISGTIQIPGQVLFKLDKLF